MVLLASSLSCHTSESVELPRVFECTGTTPNARFVGNWHGRVGGQELKVMLKQVCSGLNFQTFWSIEGTWTWGGVSEGTALALASLFLKANPSGSPFRGLQITVEDTASVLQEISGTATGEFPLTQSQSGAWQTISGTRVTLVRQ